VYRLPPVAPGGKCVPLILVEIKCGKSVSWDVIGVPPWPLRTNGDPESCLLKWP
jgi:hypothetical protein